MAQVAATSTDPRASRLAAECRERPVVFDGVRSDLCPALEQVILGRMQGDHGRRVGSINIGGWKSGEDFLSWPEDVVQEFRRELVERVGGRLLVGWAMVNRAGSQHPRHQHRVAILTGIYYVAPGSLDAITPTVFECPCDGTIVRGESRYELEVDPHPGRLALFRGEMWHRVPAYRGDLPRVTIAFDVRR